MKLVLSLLIFSLFLSTILAEIKNQAEKKIKSKDSAISQISTKNHYCDKKCYPFSKKSSCYYGTEKCKLPGYYHYPKYGYKCKCPSKPPSPSPSSSPKPKCYGYLYEKCFPYHFPIWKCPYGWEHCSYYSGYKKYYGKKCQCIIKPSPSSTPTPTRTPTPTPKPKCDKKCYSYVPKCSYGYSQCYYYYGHYKKLGYQCKCDIPYKPPPGPGGSTCPVEEYFVSKARTYEYKIDLKQSSGCFKIDYYYYYSPYTIYVYYEGKTLVKDRVNYPPKKPLDLCYHGYSSYITVKINTGLYNKIHFKVYCPYKHYY